MQANRELVFNQKVVFNVLLGAPLVNTHAVVEGRHHLSLLHLHVCLACMRANMRWLPPLQFIKGSLAGFIN